MITTQKITGYNCPNKYLLLVDNKPILFANSQKKVSEIIQFIEGYADLRDGKVKRLLKRLGITKEA